MFAAKALLLSIFIFALAIIPAAAHGAQDGAGQNGFTAEQVSFKTDDGVTIAGTFYRPSKLRMEKVPVVILLHALGGTRADWAAFAKECTSEGYAALAIDLRGHGESLSFPGGTRRWQELADADIASMYRDVKAAAAWITSRREANEDRIAIVGASIGANLAINYSITDPRVRTVVLLSPGLNYRGIDSMFAAEHYGTRAIMIVASESDQPAGRDAETLYEAVKKHASQPKLKMYPGSLHGANLMNGANGLDRIIFAWFGNHLLFY